MKIIQCWDDGVNDDVRLCELLRGVDARATFNLNPGLHGRERGPVSRYKDKKDVVKLARGELVETYKGFTIANHSRTHPWPTRIPIEDWRHEVLDARKELQDLFGQEIRGFAYPFGDVNEATAAVVRDAGHVYARTCVNRTPCYPPDDPMLFAADCHFAVPDFWERFERAKATSSPVFYFWGHSYELVTEDDWRAFAEKLKRLNEDPDTEWADIPDLFAGRPE